MYQLLLLSVHFRIQDSLRTLKRLLQILAGIPSTSLSTYATTDTNKGQNYDPDSDDDVALEPEEILQVIDGKLTVIPLTTPTATTASTTTSTGRIDRDDIVLVQQVITKIAASLLNTPTRKDTYEDSYDSIKQSETRIQRLNIIRTQLISILPLLRESAPGLYNIV